MPEVTRNKAVQKLDRRYIDICETLDWRVHEYVDGRGERRVELESYSPAGENLVLDFGVENFVDEVKEYAECFDADEHAAELIQYRGTKGVPSSIRLLINDADKIDKMLEELAQKLFCEKMGWR